ncbi:restriction endonuclease [Microbispora rosea]|uniref:restriction endonuclease n=1 Tax=Microbispora rosea TaxID=58117 RepID=UPI0037A381B8
MPALWTKLTIGKFGFRWLNHIPTFLTFLFAENEVFVDQLPQRTKLGYRTNGAAARDVLDGHGYTIEFLAGIYDTFRSNLDAIARAAVAKALVEADSVDIDEEAMQHRIDDHFSASAASSLEDMKTFRCFLREMISEGIPRILMWMDNAGISELEMLAISPSEETPVAVLRLAGLFREYSWDYPEVVTLIHLRLILDAVPDDTIVELDLSDMAKGEAEVRSLHIDLATQLLHKVDAYQRMFRVLSDRESDLQDRYARTQIRNALTDLDNYAGGHKSKGDVLEELMAAAFSIKPHLQVVQTNYRTGDEEIDLIVKNNVDRPFWQNLNSSLIFVECKNWSKPVGAIEIRNFEIKLQNHAPLVRVGILVAPNGFTKEVSKAVMRSSRDPYIMVLVDRADLDRLVQAGRTVLDWLEDLLCRVV